MSLRKCIDESDVTTTFNVKGETGLGPDLIKHKNIAQCFTQAQGQFA